MKNALESVLLPATIFLILLCLLPNPAAARDVPETFDDIRMHFTYGSIGAGATEKSLDLASMKRVEDWIWELKPPPFPADRGNHNGGHTYGPTLEPEEKEDLLEYLKTL